MDSKELKKTLEPLMSEADIKTVLSGFGYMHKDEQPLFDVDKIKQDMEAAQKETLEQFKADHEAAMARIKEITDTCLLADMPQMISEMIASDKDIDEVKRAVLKAKEEEVSQTEIVSTVGATSTGDVNPVIADAKRRAAAAQKQGGE